MFGAVPASLLLEHAKSMGVYYQLELDLGCPEYYFINPEYLTSVPETLSYYDSKGRRYGSITTVDHPSFTKLRKHLCAKKLITIEPTYNNGDRVKEPFYLNNVLMEVGDKFLCGAAMGCGKKFVDSYNNGQVLGSNG